MAKKGIVRTFFGSITNVKEFIDFNELKNDARVLKNAIKDTFKPDDTKRQIDETFEEAMQRLNLTEDDVKKQAKFFLHYSIFYALFALSFIIYAIYLFSLVKILASVTTLVLGIFLATYALKENFMYMQIKKRKLNCKFPDWFRFIFSFVGGKKHEKQ
jgi:intracellular multiplication protein IcmV